MSNIGIKQRIQEHIFSASDITVSPAVDNGSIANIIDGDTGTQCRLGTSGAERGFYTFNLGTKKLIERIKFKHGKNDKWRIELSNNNTDFIIDKEVVFAADFARETFFINAKTPFQYIRISTVGDEDGSSVLDQPRLFEFQLFTYELADFEFNDTVLTTKAWNSSRYDGRQLKAVRGKNRATKDDTGNYGRTPILRDLTRTFYIASDITSLSNDGSEGQPIEDTSLQYIPEFSYVVINKSVTINSDNSIKVTDVSTFNTSPELGFEAKRKREGFDRDFALNIPDGSFIGIKNLDADIKDFADISYKVYFNGGRLVPILRFIKTFSSDPNQPSVDASQRLKISSTGGTLGGSLTIKNRKAIRKFFTGSIDDTKVNTAAAFSFFEPMLTFRDTDLSKPRFFVSMLNTSASSAPSPTATDIEVIRTVSDVGGNFPTENLAELSTAELNNKDETNTSVNGMSHTPLYRFEGASSTFGFNQQYKLNPSSSPPAYSGSYEISILNKEKPALLVNLTKEKEFPEGIGRTPLVIIPQNLHPYIKDNIPTFMAQAGFDIGDITKINTLDETNRTLS